MTGYAGYARQIPGQLFPCRQKTTDFGRHRQTQSLAERFRLTAYDAIYLELAQRKQLALASLDQDLCSAATTVGVPVLGSRGVRLASSEMVEIRRAEWCGAAV